MKDIGDTFDLKEWHLDLWHEMDLHFCDRFFSPIGQEYSFLKVSEIFLSQPRIRLNNLNTSLRFPCLGLNPIIDYISLLEEKTIETNRIYDGIEAETRKSHAIFYTPV